MQFRSWYTRSTPDRVDDAQVRTQRHRLGADKFRILLDGWTWQEFCRDLDPSWLFVGCVFIILLADRASTAPSN